MGQHRGAGVFRHRGFLPPDAARCPTPFSSTSRLIANAVIYYNTVRLSRVYEQKQAAGDQAAMAAIRGMSPVAWRHVNLIGKFEFSTSEPKVDIDALVARYADPAFWSKALKEETGGDLS